MAHEGLKQRLESELKTVTTELNAIATQNPSTGDWVAVPEEEIGNPDPNDAADVVEGWNERRAAMEQLEIRYRNITRALEKFDAGTYGVCEISEEEIEAERLAANPAARTNMANMDREKELPI
tara:strand:+ start:919 stop:1287 length:369 start_codon:yes stop_codon:yes gene_type:complete